MESNIIKIELATRPIKTLLQILYNFFIENYSSTIFKTSILKGLCKIVQHDIMLGSRRIYTKKEINLLLKFIKKNRPKPGKKFYCYKMSNSLYYWPHFELKRRKEWLEYHINRL